MFNQSAQIRELVELLDSRQASIWHACQLDDFRSYLKIGGVPSRQRLEREHLPFTAFESDRQDRSNGVWDKVFFNLGDFGRPFAWGRRATPTVYGPIALQVAPRALLQTADVGLCLRSAGGRAFDRGAESLSSVEEVDQLFSYPLEAGFPYSSIVRFGDSLKEAFPFAKEARRPEISCSVGGPGLSNDGAVTLESLVVVWVDPIYVDGRPLIDEVRAAIRAAGIDVPVHERSMISERRELLQDITGQLLEGYVQLGLLPGRHGVSASTQEWAYGLKELELDWLWDCYARYLIAGTLKPMGGLSAAPMKIDAPRTSIPRPARVAEILQGLKEQ